MDTMAKVMDAEVAKRLIPPFLEADDVRTW